MLEGIKIVLLLFFTTLILSLPLGAIVALLRVSKNKIITNLVKVYILVMRGTPLLLQLIFVYFALPSFGIVLNPMTAAIIAFIINYAAYYAEIFRGGIESIDEGQYEAAKVLGFDKKTMYKRIIFPQVFKRVLPPISNEIIALVKDTSLVYILGLNDILRYAQIISNREAGSFLPFIQAGAFYLIMTAILTKILSMLEKKYSYYR